MSFKSHPQNFEDVIVRLKGQLAAAYAWGHGLEEEMGWRLTQVDTDHQATVRQLAQSETQLNEVAASRDHADRLIKEVIAEKPSRWCRLGFALGFDRLSPAQAALCNWSIAMMPPSDSPGVQTLPTDYSKESSMPPHAMTAQCNPYLRANSLDELLSWHDVDFVRCAYVTVLGRQPDREGEAEYTEQIQNGTSKMQVIRQLRGSREGRDHDPGIAGLDRALRRFRNATRPLLGPVVRQLTGREGNSPIQRQLRALSNQSAVARLERTREFSFIHRQFELQSAGLNAVRTESCSVGETLKEIAGIQHRLDEHSALVAALFQEACALRTAVIQSDIVGTAIAGIQDRLDEHSALVAALFQEACALRTAAIQSDIVGTGEKNSVHVASHVNETGYEMSSRERLAISIIQKLQVN